MRPVIPHEKPYFLPKETKKINSTFPGLIEILKVLFGKYRMQFPTKTRCEDVNGPFGIEWESYTNIDAIG